MNNSYTALSIIEATIAISRSNGPVKNTVLSEWTTPTQRLAKELSTPVIGEKNGSYFIRCTGTKRDNKHTANNARILVIDGDSRIDADGVIRSGAPHPKAVHDVLARRFVGHCLYSSHSNAMPQSEILADKRGIDSGGLHGDEFHKYRVIIPCQYEREDLPALLDHLFKILHDNGVMLAPVSENKIWSQPWFFPRVPDQHRLDAFKFYQFDGGSLDVEAITSAWRPTESELIVLQPALNDKPYNPLSTDSLAGNRSPIEEFNAAHDWRVVLERNGYKDYELGRMIRPGSSSKIGGIAPLFGCKDGRHRFWSFGGDCLNDEKAHDAFDSYRLLECGGDFKKALKWNPEITKHNQRLFMQQKDSSQSSVDIDFDAITNSSTCALPDEKYDVIEDTLAKLSCDIAAWDTTDFKEAMAKLYKEDRQEYRRILHKLKAFQLKTEVEKAIKVFLKLKKFSKNATHPALSTESISYKEKSSTQSSTKPTLKTIKYGELITVDEETGNSVLVIESDGAVILAKYLRGKLSYNPKFDNWCEFIGTHWLPLEKPLRVDNILTEMIYIGSGSVGFRACYLENVKSLIIKANLLPLPEANNDYLPFKNGLLNYQTRELITITPENAQTWVLPYDYSPELNAPHTQGWLKRSVDGDCDTVALLSAWLAALLYGRADLQKFLHLKGVGGTGKGTFMRLAVELIGKHNAVSTTLNLMESNRFETSRFFEKRLVMITDSDKYGSSINCLKALTGQDPIRAEKKYGHPYGDFIYNGLVVMASNENLTTTDHSSGLERRRLTVEFDKQVTDEEKQYWDQYGGIETVLRGEIAGLVNWLLDLSQDQISESIRKPPQKTLTANIEAMKASNAIAEWTTENIIKDSSAWTQIGDKREIRAQGFETEFEHSDERLYPNYLKWSQRHNRQPHAVRRFKEVLSDTLRTLKVEFIETRRSSGVGLCGIRLKKEWENSIL